MNAAVDVVLFDFFGTLVDYEPDRTRLTYPRTYDLVHGWGAVITHEDFLTRWDAASAGLEAKTIDSCREFAMPDAAAAFASSSGLDLSDEQCDELGATFVSEWQDHVVPVPGAAEMVRRLSGAARLGIVSNTHGRRMVPSMIQTMGLTTSFELILLSVDHGRVGLA